MSRLRARLTAVSIAAPVFDVPEAPKLLDDFGGRKTLPVDHVQESRVRFRKLPQRPEETFHERVELRNVPGLNIDIAPVLRIGNPHIPRVCIEDVREMEFGKAFPKRSIR